MRAFCLEFGGIKKHPATEQVSRNAHIDPSLISIRSRRHLHTNTNTTTTRHIIADGRQNQPRLRNANTHTRAPAASDSFERKKRPLCPRDHQDLRKGCLPTASSALARKDRMWCVGGAGREGTGGVGADHTQNKTPPWYLGMERVFPVRRLDRCDTVASSRSDCLRWWCVPAVNARAAFSRADARSAVRVERNHADRSAALRPRLPPTINARLHSYTHTTHKPHPRPATPRPLAAAPPPPPLGTRC